MEYTPLFDNVLVVLEKDEMEITEAGILLAKDPNAPEAEMPLYGEVASVGPGIPRENGEGVYPMSVKVGDRVLLSGTVGFDIRYKGAPSLLLNVTDILAIVTGE